MKFTARSRSVDDAGPAPCNHVTPHRLSVAVGDMEIAYTNAAGRNAKYINVGGGNIGGLTLRPGVYRWGTDVHVYADARLKAAHTMYGFSNIEKSHSGC